jgi:hypothetical protein
MFNERELRRPACFRNSAAGILTTALAPAASFVEGLRSAFRRTITARGRAPLSLGISDEAGASRSFGGRG